MRLDPTAPILIVDDEADAAMLTRHALEKLGVLCPLVAVESGQQAVDFLAECVTKGILPRLVFLDLKMPGMDGFGVLEWIMTQPALEQLLVVVLTTSTEPSDVERASALGARVFVEKFPALDDVKSVLELAGRLQTADQIRRAPTALIRRAGDRMTPERGR